MKTTVTEEYEDGQLVRRTTVTDGEPATGGYVWPTAPTILNRCTCGPWHSVMPPPPCPVHGQAIMPTITVSANTDATPAELADRASRALRATA